MQLRRWLTAAAAIALTAPLTAGSANADPRALALAKDAAARLGTTLSTAEGSVLASGNVSLLTTFPGTYAGVEVMPSGKRAIASGWDGVTSLDISDPASPKLESFLPLPHFENEDIQTDGKIALISNDREKGSVGGVLYIVDVSKPQISLLSTLNISDPNNNDRGPGHIANCIKAGCSWVWLTGGLDVYVADLRDPAHPKLAGKFTAPVSAGSAGFGTKGKARTGAVHDADVDDAGKVWVTGSGGAAVYDATNPVKPRLLATTGAKGIDPKVNDFIIHNSKRPSAKSYAPRRAGAAGGLTRKGELLLTTEEDYTDTKYPGEACKGQGKFQTWDIRDFTKGKTFSLLNQWSTELSAAKDVNGIKAPVSAMCSSHWFHERKNLVADGWYEQGLRLLDVSNPKKIRQVGYFMAPSSLTWAGTWVTDSIIYTADVGRGIDVLKVDRAGKSGAALPTVVAPVRASWLGAAPRTDLVQASARWGWACAELKAH